MASLLLCQNAQDPSLAEHHMHPQRSRDGYVDQAPARGAHPMGSNNIQSFDNNNSDQVVVLTMLDNIWRMVEYTGVPMQMFSINFSPEQLNWMFSTESTEGLPKKELNNCSLIEYHRAQKARRENSFDASYSNG